jgi:hypothetical protein
VASSCEHGNELLLPSEARNLLYILVTVYREDFCSVEIDHIKEGRGAEHIACNVRMINAHESFVRKPEEKIAFGRPRLLLKCNIKSEFKKKVKVTAFTGFSWLRVDHSDWFL